MAHQNEENPNAFKHWIGGDLLRRIGRSLKKVDSKFPQEELFKIESDLLKLELKPRVRAIREKLKELLHEDYDQALKAILKSTQDGTLKGFDLWPYADFIENYGLEYRDLSLKALYEITQLFTGEFAVRPYLLHDHDAVLKQLKVWAKDKSSHVRRWVSEGTRPRLPWGLRLHTFIQQPKLTLPLLELLKYDDELYVRKSVANHLNDISKDHPELVIATLSQWSKKAPQSERHKIEWITRHALRGLIKSGHPKALELLGFKNNHSVKVAKLRLKKKMVRMGDALEFSFVVKGDGRNHQLMIDYLVYHRKANGKLAPKVFKLKALKIGKNQEIEVVKRHSFKKVTTRKYYAGKHSLEIQINGKKCARSDFSLRAP